MLNTKGERLFIAIDLPDEIRKILRESARSIDLKGTRFSRPEQMHLTLRFLGNVNPDQKECLVGKLHEIRLSSFELEIDTLGVFPERGVSRILWAGLKSSQVLNEVQKPVETAAVACGFEAEKRPWHPHITLARLKGRNFITPEQLHSTGIEELTLNFPVEEFYLYRSELRKSGAVYTILETFRLTGSERVK